MSKTLTLKDGKLVLIEDGKENVLTEEQCASFFDRPDTPTYLFTLYLMKTQPENAAKWIELRLMQVEFVRTYLEIEKKKKAEIIDNIEDYSVDKRMDLELKSLEEEFKKDNEDFTSDEDVLNMLKEDFKNPEMFSM